jgi:hypothetical protein
VPTSTRAGDILAERYRLVDLLSESGNGRFWRAHDRVLERHVALHVLEADDPRADLLLSAAKRAATVIDARFLRVLDAERTGNFCFVVNEWGSGTSLDIMLATQGSLDPRQAAWLTAQVADSIATAHAKAVPHGRLVPENVLIDTTGGVRIIGFCVDAALHGLPPGDLRTDVRDLAGLLHAGLTGTWAGDSASSVAPVPRDHGRVLRPRQVRAGVPRILDDLCDELLNPRGSRVRDVRDLASARGIYAHLTAFVGDDTGVGLDLASRNPDTQIRVNLPFVPDIVARPDTVDFDPEDSEAPKHRAPPISLPPDTALDDALEPAELPEPVTEAGLPIFDDETGDVSWLEKRRDPPPPPPPFVEPPERPLFVEGAPRRTPPETEPRAAGGPHRGPSGDEFWPTQDRVDTSGGRGWVLGEVPGLDDEPTVEDTVPGRRWLRLAAITALVLLLIVTASIAINLGRGRTPLGAVPPGPSGTPSPTTTEPVNALVALTGVEAVDFDPEGNPPVENPDDAVNVTDGDPTTSWQTSGYFQQLGPGGLKTGVGLLLDLGETQVVRALELDLVGEGTAYEIYVSDVEPTSLAGLTPAAVAPLAGGRAGLSGETTGRYLVLWLTGLPELDDGRFRGEVVDVVVEVEVPNG